jgi:hypothetical protein
MKAKEWAASFSIANWADWQKRYVAETLELITKRGGSISALEGAVKEQEQKFRAICRIIGEDISIVFFYDAMETWAPKVWEQYGEQCLKGEKRRAHNLARLRFQQNMAKAKVEESPEMRVGLMWAAIMERAVDEEEIKALYK